MLTALRFLPWGLSLLAIAAAGFLWWKNGQLHEENGALKHSVSEMRAALEAKAAATKSRAVTNQRVRSMAPAEKLERLR